MPAGNRQELHRVFQADDAHFRCAPALPWRGSVRRSCGGGSSGGGGRGVPVRNDVFGIDQAGATAGEEVFSYHLRMARRVPCGGVGSRLPGLVEDSSYDHPAQQHL
mmetsp:Transcript_5857/g.12836  ORF Transcript_5857/g.12836 Transcript_5857/m.12836 type:complete len:106 (+) Transcript_5857:782-1099(+)